MSRDAYAYIFTGTGDHAAAFCRVIAALAEQDEVRLATRRWTTRIRKGRTVVGHEESQLDAVKIAALPDLIPKLYTDATQLSASLSARAPSGQTLTLSVELTHDSCAAFWRSGGGPLVLVAANNPFTRLDVRRPRHGPWPPGATDALFERQIRADVAWLVQALCRAVHDGRDTPIALTWEAGDWPLACDSFAVHRRRPASFALDYAIAWLEANTAHRAQTLILRGKDELRALVANEPIAAVKKPGTAGVLAAREEPRERVLALLDCDDARVEAAVDVLAVADNAMQEMEAVADEGVVLLQNAIDLDDARGDSRQRWALWPTVPEWRVMKGELGVTVVTLPDSTMTKRLLGFYSALGDLLLDR